MTEKYLLSICFVDNCQEIFSEPFGLYDSFLDAEWFAFNKINELKNNLKSDLCLRDDEIEELFEFDFTIKKIIL